VHLVLELERRVVVIAVAEPVLPAAVVLRLIHPPRLATLPSVAQCEVVSQMR